MDIEQQVYLVTGASSGLGAATARALVAGGAKVVLADVQAAPGEALAAELGTAATFCRVDVTDETQVAAAVKAAVDRGPLRGVINCAGIVAAQKVLPREGVHDLALFRRVIDINLIGSFNVSRLAAQAMATTPALADGEHGVIIHTASVAAFDGQMGQSAYAASKAAVAGMVLPMARDLAAHGIRVMAIAPGIFETPMVASMPEKVRHSLASQIPFPPRFGRPEEYAQLALHIISNRLLNGEVIRLDGAVRMGAR